ncbi:MAG: RagB/SusD family nutrient uptake outer membrane protein [Sphingobacterium sp.]|jgi:tetratricopeptide (TPR) repeat protein|nr:RagB/SusD family nutrient uptake outer membrane protein [Sphingobacterium sp.]
MKDKILYNWFILLLLLVGTTVSSCKKSFLEVEPKGKQIAETTEDYNLLLNNVQFINFNIDMQVPMGDEVAAIDPFFSAESLKTQRLFKWEAMIYEPGQNSPEIILFMNGLYAYNKIINEVMESKGGSDQTKKSIRAEALVGRAWTYFQLINYFGKPYDKATAASDLGYPIVKEANVMAAKFERASVQEVYDFIIGDLTEAMPDLLVQLTSRVRASKPSAEAILGKVYTFMGRFEEALPLLISSKDNFSNAAIPVNLYDYNETFDEDGIFPIDEMFGPSMPEPFYHEETLLGRQFMNGWTFYQSELVITENTADLYGESDLRNYFYSSEDFDEVEYPNGMLRRIGPWYTSFGVTVPDIYLLLAECKARLGDLPGAVSDLEAFRKHRMPHADAKIRKKIASDKFNLVKFIFEERIREFAMQGYRWFDMRRLSVDPDYNSLVNYEHVVYDVEGDIAHTYVLKPERLVMRLPQKIIDENPGMENNP